MKLSVTRSDLDETIGGLVGNFSIEALPKDTQKLDDLRNHLPAGTRVYVAYTSGSTSEIVEAAEKLRHHGMEPVPHIPARRFSSHDELRDFLGKLAARAAVKQVLLVGGDTTRPEGPYAASLDVLKTGMLEGHGIEAVGLAGHPEGHPSVSRDALRGALIDKCDYATKAGLEVSLVTQFLFDTDKLFAWHADFVEQTAPGIPVDVGLPGLAKMTTLMRFAKDCGVGASLGMLTRHAGRAFKLATSFSPEATLVDLAGGVRAAGRPLFRSVHFYPFGSFERTAEWLRGLQSQGPTRSKKHLAEAL
ncbi:MULTISPECIES: methylenetetrahydrofolate reductase [Aminobacter]|jgi:methylenetetrahydrofolate reductase (NADPH)|uniref:Methylenetetrahydrofolate reductase n=1 Tax=Aminobacter aminovorans TaxID=83263 RepID=A0AAC8YNI9_AMIAI|nr:MULTISPECIES: methylenetetrahydrofolate reductase [Aminobacter]AMS41572.1 metFprotein [Aminobacter aminovorans]MBB3704079.1 methylenetetrahydrofolate reductase (NADPH) [Aminobacter aminovorans]MRX33269.1 methylenetetrahydrofolate reductase [Aminobacter sp. MDW-2]QNH36885.1 methylenetetrahydrofolate reductase [Aminobacter sp. MDW-2]WMC95351.1 methylenetetrahydrofolate reductase [Aminobacter aminovorans]